MVNSYAPVQIWRVKWMNALGNHFRHFLDQESALQKYYSLNASASIWHSDGIANVLLEYKTLDDYGDLTHHIADPSDQCGGV